MPDAWPPAASNRLQKCDAVILITVVAEIIFNALAYKVNSKLH